MGLYLIGGANFDFTVAKRKYYGSFNNIRSVVGRQVNEIMVLHLLKSHCLPRLMYGCEIWPLNAVNILEFDVLWNNSFRRVFNFYWQESVKPLQFCCHIFATILSTA